MNFYPIVVYPSDVLSLKCDFIRPSDIGRWRDKLIRLEETLAMRKDAVALAANQVGLPIRAIAIRRDVSTEEFETQLFLNPVIVERDGAGVSEEEGCMSLPGVRSNVIRSPNILAQWMNVEGTTRRATITDAYLARIFQHEVDHLDGKLYIDRIGLSARSTLLRKFNAKA